MKKETFVGIINSLRSSSDKAEDIENGILSVLQKNNRDEFLYSGGFYEMYCDMQLQDDILNQLKVELDDIDDWIGYFVYELDWGRKYEDGMITDVDGSSIKMASPEDLYDFLEENLKAKKESDNENEPHIESHVVNDPMSIKDVEHIIEKYLERRKYN